MYIYFQLIAQRRICLGYLGKNSCPFFRIFPASVVSKVGILNDVWHACVSLFVLGLDMRRSN